MSLLGQFAAPVAAMMAQSKAMEVIGLNISNVNTGGYKRSETNFSTLLANSYGYNNDIGGVRGNTRSLIDQQGQILSSNSDLDVAINGNGFFMLNTALDGSGETLYGRDGTLSMALGDEITATINGNTTTTREGYLVDKNGYYIQGWPANADQETFPTDAASLGPIRIDPETFTNNGEATTTASLGLNVPSDASVGFSESTFVRAFDSSGTQQTFQLRWSNIALGTHTQTATPTWALPGLQAAGYNETNTITTYDNRGNEREYDIQWTKSATANEWEVSIFDGATALNIDSDGTPTTLTVNFDPATGAVLGSPSVSITGSGQNDEAFTIDFANISEAAAAGTITQTGFTQDGVLAAATKNKYSLEILDGNTLLPIDSASGDGTPTVLEVTFDGSGKIQSPTSVSIAGVNNNASFTLDLQDVTNYSSNELVELHYDYNGRSNARLESTYFNASGEIIGRFADATTRPIYKLPLATFVNPNTLDSINGNVYRVSGETSEMTLKTAGGHGAGSFVPNAREISNVDIANEFTSMILTQKAYNLGSTVFKSVDEMSQVARDLKR